MCSLYDKLYYDNEKFRGRAIKDQYMYFVVLHILGYYCLVIKCLWLSTNYCGIIIMPWFDLLHFSRVAIHYLLKQNALSCVQSFTRVTAFVKFYSVPYTIIFSKKTFIMLNICAISFVEWVLQKQNMHYNTYCTVHYITIWTNTYLDLT